MQLRVPKIKHPVTLRRMRGDRGAFDQVLIQRNYDQPAVCSLSNPNLIIDAGAHIGMASVFFANVFPDAKIIALEPEPGNFAMLQQNIAPYENVTALHAAAWPTHAMVGVSGESWEALTHESLTSTIPGIPLSSLAEEVDILKMDIEGAEKRIFETGALPRCRVLLIEIHDGCALAISNYLAAKTFAHSHVGDVDIFAFA